MYLSKIRLLQERISLQDIATLFQQGHPAHALAWQAFNDGNPDKTRDFLFREERSPKSMTLWTLSPKRPGDWNGYLAVESKPFAPVIRAGMRLGFKLRANPTISVSSDGKSRGKPHDVVMHKKHVLLRDGMAPKDLPPQTVLVQQAGLAWLRKQGAQHGFEVDERTTIADGYQAHRFRKNPRAHREVQFHTIDFDGALTVSEPGAFIQMLGAGLGRAKAYGNGLMLIRNIS